MKPKKGLIPYHPDLKELAREFRNNPTKAEYLLWQKLKGKQRGYDFHRQKPLGNYIVDFYCNALKLVIEVDGDIHNLPNQKIKDELRIDNLEDYGIHFLRFSNTQVLEDLAEVISAIDSYIEKFEKLNGE